MKFHDHNDGGLGIDLYRLQRAEAGAHRRTSILFARAHAMAALGLPHPWAPRTRRRMFWDELQRVVYGKVIR